MKSFWLPKCSSVTTGIWEMYAIRSKTSLNVKPSNAYSTKTYSKPFQSIKIFNFHNFLINPTTHFQRETYGRRLEKTESRRHMCTGHISASRSWDHQRAWNRARSLEIAGSWRTTNARIWWRGHRATRGLGDRWGGPARKSGWEMGVLGLGRRGASTW